MGDKEESLLDDEFPERNAGKQYKLHYSRTVSTEGACAYFLVRRYNESPPEAGLPFLQGRDGRDHNKNTGFDFYVGCVIIDT